MTLETDFPKVSVIILNYNGAKYLQNCLASVLETKYPNYEVILIDNASTDKSVDLAEQIFASHPRLKIFRNKTNLGFAEGNNVGAQYAIGKYLVFLNFDTRVDSNWLNETVKLMERDSRVGIAQCKLLLMDNPSMLDNAGHYIDCFGITYFIGAHEEDLGQYDTLYEIFGATGAAIVIRSEVFKILGGFDSDFFLLFEESDLCWRAWIFGHKVVFIPNAIVYHKGKVAFSRHVRYKENKWTAYTFVRNRLLSLLKNYELKNLVKYVPANVIIMFALSLVKIKNRRIDEAKGIVTGILWNVLNFKKTIRKRKTIQGLRKISDNELMKADIIKKFDLHRSFNKAHQFVDFIKP